MWGLVTGLLTGCCHSQLDSSTSFWYFGGYFVFLSGCWTQISSLNHHFAHQDIEITRLVKFDKNSLKLCRLSLKYTFKNLNWKWNIAGYLLLKNSPINFLTECLLKCLQLFSHMQSAWDEFSLLNILRLVRLRAARALAHCSFTGVSPAAVFTFIMKLQILWFVVFLRLSKQQAFAVSHKSPSDK